MFLWVAPQAQKSLCVELVGIERHGIRTRREVGFYRHVMDTQKRAAVEALPDIPVMRPSIKNDELTKFR